MSFNDLPKKERLLKPAQFKHIFNNGNKLRFKGSIVFFKENMLGINRLGLVVPKKAVRLASARNVTKRFLREAYRLNKAGIKPGLDIIIYVNNIIISLKDAEKLVLSGASGINKYFDKNTK